MMRRKVRTGWIAAGAALTVFAVAGMALAAWSEIRVPRVYDFSFPGSYDSSVLDESRTETRTVTYAITTHRITVDVRGAVTVRVAPGDAGRLTVRRETAWRGEAPSTNETWESGKTLRLAITCGKSLWQAESDCRTDVALSVPPDVEVLVTTPEWTMPCPPAAAVVTCGPASRDPSPEATR